MAKVAADAESDRTLVITRVFDAPREAVFDAWIDPARLGLWIGPRSVKAEVKTADARPGGAYRIFMHNQSGVISIVSGTYREVDRPQRLVFTWAWEDETGKPKHEITTVTVTFRAVGAQTEMTLRHDLLENAEMRTNHNQGWTGSFDNLASVLAGRSVVR